LLAKKSVITPPTFSPSTISDAEAKIYERLDAEDSEANLIKEKKRLSIVLEKISRIRERSDSNAEETSKLALGMEKRTRAKTDGGKPSPAEARLRGGIAFETRSSSADEISIPKPNSELVSVHSMNSFTAKTYIFPSVREDAAPSIKPNTEKLEQIIEQSPTADVIEEKKEPKVELKLGEKQESLPVQTITNNERVISSETTTPTTTTTITTADSVTIQPEQTSINDVIVPTDNPVQILETKSSDNPIQIIENSPSN